MNRRSVGTITEERASEFLTTKGLVVLEKNYRCAYGEIDVVAKDRDDTLVFVEVKYRRSLSYGLPEEAVHAGKQRTIRKVALWYVSEHRISPEAAMRFDVIAMDSNEIRWYPNAF